MRRPYAQLLAFLVCTRGWWRSFKIFRRLISTGNLASGDRLNLKVTLVLDFPEYDKIELKEAMTVNGNTTTP